MGLPKRKRSYSKPSIFRCKLLVSGSVFFEIVDPKSPNKIVMNIFPLLSWICDSSMLGKSEPKIILLKKWHGTIRKKSARKQFQAIFSKPFSNPCYFQVSEKRWFESCGKNNHNAPSECFLNQISFHWKKGFVKRKRPRFPRCSPNGSTSTCPSPRWTREKWLRCSHARSLGRSRGRYRYER